MDAFLKENGLEEYISAFSEARITIDQLDELTENHLEKMMRLGDMLRFMKAVRKRRINEQNQPETQLKRVRKSRSRENSAHSSDGAVRQTKNVRKTKPKNDPAKKLMIIKILREDEDLREKLRQSVSAIISGFSPSLSSRDRELINLEEGTVNCPFCELGFKPQIRQDSKTFAWNVYNLSRHLGEFHSEKKGQVVESTNGDDNDSYFDPKEMLQVIYGDQVDENSMGEHSLDSASNSIETSSASNDEVQPLFVAPDVAERSEGSTSSSHVQVEEKEEPMDEPMVLEPNATEENRLSESAATNVGNRKPVIDTMSDETVTPDVAERSEGSTSSSHVQVEEKEEPIDEPVIDTMSDDVQPLMKKQLSSNEIVPEWKDEGSMFGWVKFSKRERWYAGFKYADGRAQYIKTNGYLSKHIEIVPSQGEFCDDIQSSKKKKSLTALKKFNEINFSNKSQYLK